jgi:hypothetical protein
LTPVWTKRLKLIFDATETFLGSFEIFAPPRKFFFEIMTLGNRNDFLLEIPNIAQA